MIEMNHSIGIYIGIKGDRVILYPKRAVQVPPILARSLELALQARMAELRAGDQEAQCSHVMGYGAFNESLYRFQTNQPVECINVIRIELERFDLLRFAEIAERAPNAEQWSEVRWDTQRKRPVDFEALMASAEKDVKATARILRRRVAFKKAFYGVLCGVRRLLPDKAWRWIGARLGKAEAAVKKFEAEMRELQRTLRNPRE